MNATQLAEALRTAVRAQRFEQVADAMRGGAPVQQHPSIDLAVAAFPRGGAPVCANVLFSREHPQGIVADLGPNGGAVRNIAFVADLQDAQGRSIAWLPGGDWSALPWRPLFGNGPQRFVAPYPASLLKLMVAVGVARWVDAGRSDWGRSLAFEGQNRIVGDWAFDMLAFSSNTATSALVAHLHACGAIRRGATGEMHNDLHRVFEQYGLPGLRLANTQPDGGWGNAAGAGVGQIQMTAWDSLRLLWLLDPTAPPPPWLPAGTPPLLGASRAQVLRGLEEQALHEILSSGALAGLPGWVPGLPARLPARWLQPDGSRRAGDVNLPGDLRAQAAGGELSFAHKTGTTENYASDAGIVHGLPDAALPARRHYLIALTTNLGRRYAPHPSAATTWRLPALGAAVDGALKPWLEVD